MHATHQPGGSSCCARATVRSALPRRAGDLKYRRISNESVLSDTVAAVRRALGQEHARRLRCSPDAATHHLARGWRHGRAQLQSGPPIRHTGTGGPAGADSSLDLRSVAGSASPVATCDGRSRSAITFHVKRRTRPQLCNGPGTAVARRATRAGATKPIFARQIVLGERGRGLMVLDERAHSARSAALGKRAYLAHPGARTD